MTFFFFGGGFFGEAVVFPLPQVLEFLAKPQPKSPRFRGEQVGRDESGRWNEGVGCERASVGWLVVYGG